jgi:hypothetical protein
MNIAPTRISKPVDPIIAYTVTKCALAARRSTAHSSATESVGSSPARLCRACVLCAA